MRHCRVCLLLRPRCPMLLRRRLPLPDGLLWHRALLLLLLVLLLLCKWQRGALLPCGGVALLLPMCRVLPGLLPCPAGCGPCSKQRAYTANRGWLASQATAALLLWVLRLWLHRPLVARVLRVLLLRVQVAWLLLWVLLVARVLRVLLLRVLVARLLRALLPCARLLHLCLPVDCGIEPVIVVPRHGPGSSSVRAGRGGGGSGSEG